MATFKRNRMAIMFVLTHVGGLLFLVWLLWALITMAPTTAKAADAPIQTAGQTASFTEKQKAKITEVETYLNHLTTFAARFEQSVAGMQPSSGLFYVKRPGRFLWQYEEPDRVKLVSNGGLIYFHDESNNQVNQVPREGIADFLTRPNIKLTKGPFKVSYVQDNNGLLNVGIKLKDESAGDIGNNLTLTFLQDPLQLRQITTTNQFDQPVEVLFYNIHENVELKNDLFDFTPPQYREN